MTDVLLGDWSRADEGMFHSFSAASVVELCRRLNNGGLPDGYGAHNERIVSPDVFTAGTRILPADAVTATVRDEDETVAYVRRSRRLVVRRLDRSAVSVIEFASHAHKRSRSRIRAILRRSAEAVDEGLHVSVVDVHAPQSFDPKGMVDATWEELTGRTTELNGRSCGVVRSWGGLSLYAEPMAVGRPVPDLPLFLDGDAIVTLPLANAYAAALEVLPADERAVVAA